MIYREESFSKIIFVRESKRYAILWNNLCDKKFLHINYSSPSTAKPIGPTMLVEWTDE